LNHDQLEFSAEFKVQKRKRVTGLSPKPSKYKKLDEEIPANVHTPTVIHDTRETPNHSSDSKQDLIRRFFVTNTLTCELKTFLKQHYPNCK